MAHVLDTARCSATVVPARETGTGQVFLSKFTTIQQSPIEKGLRLDSNGGFKQIPGGVKKDTCGVGQSIVQKLFFCPLVYRLSHSRVTNSILYTSIHCPTAATCIGLEHPRPHAFGSHRLPSASAGEPAGHREGEGSAGEESLVREQGSLWHYINWA